MSESYFGPLENEKHEPNYIPPDYSSEDDDDDSDFDEEPSTEDEGALEELEDSKHERKEMIQTPFSDSNSPGSPWSSGGNTPSSPWTQQTGGSGIWGTNRPSWGSSGGSGWGSSFGSNVAKEKQAIPRQKSVVFCDFLDCMMETYQSNGMPGLKPRDIYDLKPRFNVWEKLAAFNPQKIFTLIPPNTLNTSNGSDGWRVTLTYWCCCLSAFLGIPYTNCQVLSQTIIGQPKEYAILQAIQMHGINRTDAVYVGIYSGVGGQSDKDIQAARKSEIDYIDLNTLLNSMS